MKIQLYVKLLIALILPLRLGSIAGLFTAQSVPNWYATLNQPVFNPPNWIFGPVWTLLYILMGVSLFLVWKQPAGKLRNRAMIVFTIQLLLNFLWSFIFFYFQWIGLALLEIVLLLIFIVLMMRLFYKVNKLAACLNIPYLLWVSFATALNAAYFLLN